jgi:branched-chain amino acid transport system permease protein
VLVTAAAVLLLFKFTGLGLRMRATAFAPEAAALAGVRVGLMVTAGTALAAAVGALAGLLAVPPLLYPTVLDGIFVYSLTAAVVGGLDNPIGTVIAGFGTGIGLSYVSGYLGPELVTLASLAILVVVLSLRPNGLFGRGLARTV